MRQFNLSLLALTTLPYSYFCSSTTTTTFVQCLTSATSFLVLTVVIGGMHGRCCEARSSACFIAATPGAVNFNGVGLLVVLSFFSSTLIDGTTLKFIQLGSVLVVVVVVSRGSTITNKNTADSSAPY